MKKSQFINHYINQRKSWRLKGNERIKYFSLCYIYFYCDCIKNGYKKGKSEKKMNHYRKMLESYRKDYRNYSNKED